MCVKKDEFRTFAKKDIRKNSRIKARCFHYPMLKNLLNLINFLHPKNILIYIPMKTEPNLSVILRNLRRNYQIFAPFMVSKSFKMVKFRQPFVSGKFGLKEPRISKAYNKKIDLAIVPILGVDRNFARIGHGKGCYDMFFSNLKYNPSVIFVSIGEYFSKQSICEKHDITCDFLLTPKKIYSKRGFYDRNFNRFSSRFARTGRRLFDFQKDKRRKLQYLRGSS